MQGLQWTPAAPAAPGKAETSRPITPVARYRFLDFARIATELSSPEAILRAVADERRGEAVPDARMSDTEAKLSAIWAELLERPVVGVTDNFFDLGGHSLLAVLLLLRIKEEFGVELPIDDVYSGTLTLGDLAMRIETFQMGAIDPAEYDRLLQEIEGLSRRKFRRCFRTRMPADANPADIERVLRSSARWIHAQQSGLASHLAQNGHECRVVCAALSESQETVNEGIRIFSVSEFVRNSDVLRRHIREFQPDWVLVSSEDVSHILLRDAHQAHRAESFTWHTRPSSTRSDQPLGIPVLARLKWYVKPVRS